MKKTINVLAILVVMTFLALTGKAYAASLDSVSVDVDKTTVNPGDEVTVSISFGQELGAYTFNIEYDSSLFEYVSADGGTANDTGDKVIVVYYDSTGGSESRTDMSVTFKAVSGITASSSTEFSITAEGLANGDASETYDDITTAIVKDVTVEPTTTEETTDETDEDDTTDDETEEEEEETVLPKTGNNIYASAIVILIALFSLFVYINKKQMTE